MQIYLTLLPAISKRYVRVIIVIITNYLPFPYLQGDHWSVPDPLNTCYEIPIMIAFWNCRYYCIIVLLSYVSVMIIAVLSLCSGNCRELDVGNLACLNMLLRPGATQGRSSGWVTWLDFRSCRQREWLNDFLMLLFSIFSLRICGNHRSLQITDVLIKCTGCRF